MREGETHTRLRTKNGDRRGEKMCDRQREDERNQRHHMLERAHPFLTICLANFPITSARRPSLRVSRLHFGDGRPKLLAIVMRRCERNPFDVRLDMLDKLWREGR